MTTFFFDVTGLVAYLRSNDRYSGIQRVVAMLVDRCTEQLGSQRARLAWNDGSLRGYRTVACGDLPDGALRDPDILSGVFGLGTTRGLRGERTLARYRSNKAKFLFHRAILDLEAALGGSRRLRKFNTSAAEWRIERRRHLNRTTSARTVSFDQIATRDDHLIILDTVGSLELAQVFESAAAKGVRISTLVHDTIPLTHLPLVPGLSPLHFHDWLRRSAGYTTRYLANSQATRRDLARFLAVYGIETPVTVVPLAQDRLPVPRRRPGGPLTAGIDADAFGALLEIGDLDDQIRALAATPFVLCAGTLENRKNIWRVALAWERLRADPALELPRLVFAGRPGWRSVEFDALMRGTGNLGGHVEIVSSPSDRDLDYLYRESLFCIQASLAEGWGLTVGEALSYGKTSVVARATSLPEVGGEMVEYCDPLSVASIAAACRRLIADPDHRRALEARIARTRLRSWDDVARDLIAAVEGEERSAGRPHLRSVSKSDAAPNRPNATSPTSEH
jgi:glycosyltransferase involved in cell wall biosynthesis